jgi:tyrosyl-tRNA synthetase
MKDFIAELGWRGLIHDLTPGVQEKLNEGMVAGYVGFDPTADSLHVGNLVPVMLLVQFQRCGHKPVVLVGGATGLVGDPSGKKSERPLLPVEELQANLAAQEKQLRAFLDFGKEYPNPAEVVNNYDWFKNMGFLEFIRDVGKHISINYMLAKDSVQSRLESGMSFTEFTYQLVQGYDFLHLYREKKCLLQMGGSDQWGNIVTGTELIRRMDQGEAYAVTAPLLKKSDGSKFGKSEEGNVWLDRNKTSPYKFYQFWLNQADEDAPKLVKIFSLKEEEEINTIINEHQQAPHLRKLQTELAEELTERVHSREDLESAREASRILFGKSTTEELARLNEQTFNDIFEGVPRADITRSTYTQAENITDLLSSATEGIIFSSKGEARRMIKSGAVSVNKQKVQSAEEPLNYQLLNDKYLLVQRGKKNYYVVTVHD